jgi:hypothetical protein
MSIFSEPFVVAWLYIQATTTHGRVSGSVNVLEKSGSGHDKALAAIFIANQKKEKNGRRGFRTREDARQVLFDYIELF